MRAFGARGEDAGDMIVRHLPLESRKQRTGALRRFFDQQQMAGIRNGFVVTAVKRVQRTADFTGCLGIRLIGGGTNQFHWQRQLVQSVRQVKRGICRVDPGLAFGRATQRPLARVGFLTQNRARHRARARPVPSDASCRISRTVRQVRWDLKSGSGAISTTAPNLIRRCAPPRAREGQDRGLVRGRTTPARPSACRIVGHARWR